jgi:hypothetical protein
MWSWWWAEEPPETYRASVKINQETLHLVGCNLELHSFMLSRYMTPFCSERSASIKNRQILKARILYFGLCVGSFFSQLHRQLTYFPYKAVRSIIFTPHPGPARLAPSIAELFSVTVFTSRLTSVDSKAAPTVSGYTLVPARRLPQLKNITVHRHPQQNVSLTSIIHLTFFTPSLYITIN